MNLGFEPSPWLLYFLVAVIVFIVVAFIAAETAFSNERDENEEGKPSSIAKEPKYAAKQAEARSSAFTARENDECRNPIIDDKHNQPSTVGKILFFITAFYACAVVGAFIADGTSLAFGIFTSEPMVSGITSAVLSFAGVTFGFIIFRKRKLTLQPLMGLGIILALAVTYGMAAYIGPSASTVSPGVAEVQNEAAQTISMAQEAIWPLIPLVIAVFCTIPAIRMIDPDGLK